MLQYTQKQTKHLPRYVTNSFGYNGFIFLLKVCMSILFKTFHCNAMHCPLTWTYFVMALWCCTALFSYLSDARFSLVCVWLHDLFRKAKMWVVLNWTVIFLIWFAQHCTAYLSSLLDLLEPQSALKWLWRNTQANLNTDKRKYIAYARRRTKSKYITFHHSN